MEPKPWLDKIVKDKWKLTKDKCTIVRLAKDNSGNYTYKVMIYTPELHLETQPLFQLDYAEAFIKMVTAANEHSKSYKALRRLIYRLTFRKLWI